jgi:lysyl-tRNA synthetase class 2
VSEGQAPTAPTAGEIPVEESARARRRRLKEIADAARQEALAAGATPEEAERAAAKARAGDQHNHQGRRARTGTTPGASPPGLGTPAPSRRPAGTATLEPARTPPVRPELEPSAEGPSLDLVRRFLQPSKAPARIGNFIYLLGIVNVLSGVRHSLRGPLGSLSHLVPGVVTDAATAATVVAGVLFIALAHSLKRRKRRAWVATTALAAISVALHLVRGLHAPVAMVFAAIGLILLLVYRAQFRALGDPRTRWGALWAFLGLLVGSFAVGLLLIAGLRHTLVGGWPGFGPALSYIAQGLVGSTGDLVFRPRQERTEDVIGAVLLGLGLLTVLLPVYLFFRAPNQPARLTPEDDARVRQLLVEHPDSLGYFATREDKHIVWSESGKSGIGYRVVSGVMLAGGDPLGDPEAWPGAIRTFLAEANAHGWTPAVLGCSEVAGTTWVRETGFQALEIGDEAIVDADTFSIEGRSMRNVRQMVNRVRRQGYTTELHRVADLTDAQRAQAEKDTDAWRVGATERGFSMATSRALDVEHDPDSVVVYALREGKVEGMLKFVPWGTDGMSLDLMRRNPKADPGINELLIVDALTLAKEQGIHRVSLNFAMFRSAFERGERLGAGPVLRMWRRFLIIGNTWFQLESLYKFNAKFQPQWLPRYVIYPRVADIARVGIAMGQAEAFIVLPDLRFWRRS